MASPTDVVTSVATQMPGYDATPVVNALEGQLAQYLNTPTADILGRLGLPVPAGIPAPGPIPGLPAIPGLPQVPGQHPADGGNTLASIDGGALIQPVLDALGTLGSGVFEALNPAQMFGTIASAFSSVASSIPQLISAMQTGWEGHGADAAAAKTAQLGKDGTAVGVQSTKIAGNVTQAGVDTKTTEAHLLEIMTQFQATMAIALPMIVTPVGQAMALAAATDAMTRTTATMAAHKGKMAVNTAEVAADGTPVAVTDAPGIPTEMIGPMVQMASGLAQPAFGLVGNAFTAGQKIVQSSVEAGTKINKAVQDQKTKAAKNTHTTTPGKNDAARKNLTTGAGEKGKGGAGGGKGGGGGGGGVAGVTPPPAARTAMSGVGETPGGQNGARTISTGGGGTTTSGMTGGPMGAAPMGAGAGAGAGAGGKGGGHTAADFLHTSVTGSEIVGDFEDVAPAVIGETEAVEIISPDIDLRI